MFVPVVGKEINKRGLEIKQEGVKENERVRPSDEVHGLG